MCFAIKSSILPYSRICFGFFKNCNGVILKIVSHDELAMKIRGQHGAESRGESETFPCVVEHLLEVLLGLLGGEGQAVLERVIEAPDSDPGVGRDLGGDVGGGKLLHLDGVDTLLACNLAARKSLNRSEKRSL